MHRGGSTLFLKRLADWRLWLRRGWLPSSWWGRGSEEENRSARCRSGSLKIVDPIWTTAYITRNHAYMVWDTLFALDANNVPSAADGRTAWTVSDDKLTYTFKLRDGLKWHDNAPVRAVDCVASLKRWAAKDGMGRALWEFVAAHRRRR